MIFFFFLHFLKCLILSCYINTLVFSIDVIKSFVRSHIFDLSYGNTSGSKNHIYFINSCYNWPGNRVIIIIFSKSISEVSKVIIDVYMMIISKFNQSINFLRR